MTPDMLVIRPNKIIKEKVEDCRILLFRVQNFLQDKFYFLHFRCKLNQLENDTYKIFSDYHRELINVTIPESKDGLTAYDQCHYNEYDEDSSGINATKRKCFEWVYDKSVITASFSSEVSLTINPEANFSNDENIFVDD